MIWNQQTPIRYKQDRRRLAGLRPCDGIQKNSPPLLSLGTGRHSFRLDEECWHVTGLDAWHDVGDVAGPVLNLVAVALLLHEIVEDGLERVVVAIVDNLIHSSLDATDIDEVSGGMNDLIECDLMGVAAVVLCEDAADRDILD